MDLHLWFVFLLLIYSGHLVNANPPSGYSCARELDRCTSSVNPLLRSISYMFPANEEEVKKMCSSWSKLVDCVRKYVNNCFSAQRKQNFNAAVENSIGTVHAICSSNAIQREYLLNAKCFRKVSIENCRITYNQLVDFVSTPKSTDEHICCGYSKFRECVNEPLANECGAKARNLMHHSLAFLMQKCESQVDLTQFTNRDCPTLAVARSLDETASMTAHFEDTENDYYLNEKQPELRLTNEPVTPQPIADNHFIASHVNHSVNNEEPDMVADNNRKTLGESDQPNVALAREARNEEDESVDAQVHPSTESPQYVRYYGPDSSAAFALTTSSYVIVSWLCMLFSSISKNLIV